MLQHPFNEQQQHQNHRDSFRSYVTVYENEPQSVAWLVVDMLQHPFNEQQQHQNHRDSFRSYVTVYENESQSVKNGGDAPDFALLNGEIISSQCDDVLLYPPFEENYFGKLYCTNFRICFVPLTQQQQRDPCCSRCLFFDDDHQVPLCCIAAVHYTSSPIGMAVFHF
ncbi:unnamed protein product [Gongylonema pulchrum]|uniref:Myotubularin phosphatase domain-containing protein n=1 Tax=Gongylonema pulchrum TaxID=637853 RepID=A0A183E487_9BILA|nr:unnamed protein product [Gongylonema pulchrum]